MGFLFLTNLFLYLLSRLIELDTPNATIAQLIELVSKSTFESKRWIWEMNVCAIAPGN